MAKRALLIGINEYRIDGANLRGCVNDVLNIERALTKHFEFPAASIKKLFDAQATKKRIEAGIKALFKGSKKGDVLFLHYSGHGSNTPDLNGDEVDRRDEILCPTDLDWKDPLTDDWLRRTIDAMLPEKVNLTIIMDCCHSGSNTRRLLPPDAPIINRYLPNPYDLAEVESGRSIKGTVHHTRAVAKPKGKGKSRGSLDVAVADMPEILITGCRDYQTSADAFIGGSYNGALTYHLAKAIEAKKGKLTYRNLHEVTSKLISDSRYEQVPQLEGRAANLDRPFLAPLT
jgi:metacaspase-1